jgi:uncharacterized protein (TIGR02246 family)
MTMLACGLASDDADGNSRRREGVAAAMRLADLVSSEAVDRVLADDDVAASFSVVELDVADGVVQAIRAVVNPGKLVTWDRCMIWSRLPEKKLACGPRVNGGLIMATQHAVDEADIRQRIDNLVQAIRAMDLEGVKPIYAPDIVSFDIVPPLQHVGAEAKWKNWVDVFTVYQRPLGYDVRDLTITVGDDVAFGHSLNRISGTLKNGNRSDYWVRCTTCFRKIDGNWLIVHDQVSVPFDVESGRALLNLEP